MIIKNLRNNYELFYVNYHKLFRKLCIVGINYYISIKINLDEKENHDLLLSVRHIMCGFFIHLAYLLDVLSVVFT